MTTCHGADLKTANQTKYAYIKAMNFIIHQWNHGIEINGIEIFWTYNEGKSAVIERVIRTLKNKIYKYMSVITINE